MKLLSPFILLQKKTHHNLVIIIDNNPYFLTNDLSEQVTQQKNKHNIIWM